MASKRKNSSKALSSMNDFVVAADGKKENHNNTSTASPSKSSKRVKPSANTEVSNPISVRDGASLPHWSEANLLKLLKTLIVFRGKNGAFPTESNMKDFLTEIQEWAPSPISEKILNKKLRQLHYKFQHSPKPVSQSSEFDRSFYPLALKIWGSEKLKEKDSVPGNIKDVLKLEVKSGGGSKKDKGSQKKEADSEKEGKDEVQAVEKNSDNDLDTEDNGLGHEKDDLLVEGDNGYLYKYLQITLEEYWAESKMNMDALHTALPKVDSAKAKRLNEEFRKIYVGMLKLKMESNKISNEIIRASLGC